MLSEKYSAAVAAVVAVAHPFQILLPGSKHPHTSSTENVLVGQSVVEIVAAVGKNCRRWHAPPSFSEFYVWDKI